MESLVIFFLLLYIIVANKDFEILDMIIVPRYYNLGAGNETNETVLPDSWTNRIPITGMLCFAMLCVRKFPKKETIYQFCPNTA